MLSTGFPIFKTTEKDILFQLSQVLLLRCKHKHTDHPGTYSAYQPPPPVVQIINFTVTKNKYFVVFPYVFAHSNTSEFILGAMYLFSSSPANIPKCF